MSYASPYSGDWFVGTIDTLTRAGFEITIERLIQDGRIETSVTIAGGSAPDSVTVAMGDGPDATTALRYAMSDLDAIANTTTLEEAAGMTPAPAAPEEEPSGEYVTVEPNPRPEPYDDVPDFADSYRRLTAAIQSAVPNFADATADLDALEEELDAAAPPEEPASIHGVEQLPRHEFEARRLAPEEAQAANPSATIARLATRSAGQPIPSIRDRLARQRTERTAALRAEQIRMVDEAPLGE